MSDEALRALEKECRDRAVELTAMESRSRAYGDESTAYARGFASFEVMSIADELAAILSARQEVAPVDPVGYMDPDADFMLPRKGQCVLSSHVVLVRDPHGKYTRPLYLSPAQTSEARDAQDAARYRYLRDADPDSGLPYIAKERQDSWGNYHTDWLGCAEADRECDAAMRQEAGDV